MKPVTFLASSLLLCALPVAFSSTTKYVEIVASEPKQFPSRPRIKIPSSFAKKYWVSGTFFNEENFSGLPMSFYFNGGQCVNFPTVEKSVKPTGCVMLFRDKDCTGPYSVVSDDQPDLQLSQIKSMKTCPPVDDSWKGASGAEYTEKSTNSEASQVPETPTYETIDLGKIKINKS